MQVRNPGFALVKDWTSKNRSTGDVQHYLRMALGLLKEGVSLKACDRCQGIDGIGFSYRHDVVRHGIDAEFRLVEILHDVSIAQLGEVNDAIDVAREIRPVFDGYTVTGTP